MVGCHGLASTRLNPDGYVQIRGESWRASNLDEERAIEKGDRVHVEAVEGLRLQVVRLSMKRVRE
jgi:membrane-bound ClpP family serine protease